jgi:hypothetical protein
MKHAQPSLFDRDILPLFEEHRRDWLEHARTVAFRLGTTGRAITVDDVRALVPPPAHVDPRVMGAIFRTSDWEPIGYVRSDRRTCHNRPIAQFKLKGY